MVYRVETVGEDIDAAIDALPAEFLAACAQLRVAIELTPWEVGRPHVVKNPTGSRTAEFGPGSRGMVLLAVMDYEQVVAIRQVTVFPDVDP